MRTITDFYKERAEKMKVYFENFIPTARKIKQEFEATLGETEVYVFGSILNKSYSPYQSDIDILIVSPNTPLLASDRSEIKSRISQKLNLPPLFEIHLVTPEEYKNWYSYLIKEKVAVY